MKYLIRWLRSLGMTHLQRLELDLMNASDQLAANVTALQNAEAAYVAAVQAKLSAPVADDQNVVAANTAIESVTASLTAATEALAPAPSPAPAAGDAVEQPAQ